MSKFNVGDKVIWTPFGKSYFATIAKTGPLGSEGQFDYAVSIDGDTLNAYLGNMTGDGGEWALEGELRAVEV